MMRRIISVLLLGVLVTLAVNEAAEVKDESQKLMLILMDGFRWDYVEKYNLDNFKRFYKGGVRAQNVENVYPTLSFANYYSIVTGLYPESHGMVGNMIYDRGTGKTFNQNINAKEYVDPYWWEGAWPIWVSVEKQGKTAYMYHWFGPDVLIHDTRPKFVIPYTGNPTPAEFRQATKDGLAALRNGSANFVGIYSEEPDYIGHKEGPNSPNVEAVLTGIDRIIGTLLDEMEDLSPDEKVNLMIVSDHGMTDIESSRVINVTSLLTPDLYTTITEDYSIINIFLSDPSVEDKVYNLLSGFHPNMTVYRRENIPDRFHYKHGKHVPKIVCMADLGWTILHPLKPEFSKISKTGKDYKGMHGFDNAMMDMRGIFFGMGPYFKAGSSVKSIRVVDLYNVMCQIMEVTPRPNNGTIQHMSPLLASGAQSQIICSQIIALSTFIILFLFSLYAITN